MIYIGAILLEVRVYGGAGAGNLRVCATGHFDGRASDMRSTALGSGTKSVGDQRIRHA